MNKLIVVAALALALGTVQQAVCEFGIHAANATPIVVADSCPAQNCATDEPTTSAPVTLACTGSDC